MRYVVVGFHLQAEEFRYQRCLPRQQVIPVPAAGTVGQALMGLNPEEVTIVLVPGSAPWVDAEALAHIERFRAQGAQFLVYE